MSTVPSVSRRSFLRSSLVLGGTLGGSLLASRGVAAAWAGPATVPGDGPYGPLLSPNKHGLQLPAGFRSRIVAVTGTLVAGSTYAWHKAPDGGHVFADRRGGWVYISNSEVSDNGGGVGALRFDRKATLIGGYSILSNTSRNCAGGPTPWGNWLSCEESGKTGHVWECQPLKPGQGVERPRLGSFNHEAAAIDAVTGAVYLTEDDPKGRLYRFVPARTSDLSDGELFAASVVDGTMTWIPTSDAEPDRQTGTTSFDGGEGIWIEGNTMYFTTKNDKSVWKVLLREQTIEKIYSGDSTPNAALNAVDNITVNRLSGDLFVAEDGGNMELCLLRERRATSSKTSSKTRTVEVSPFVRIVGHDESEITGPAFTPNARRLYFSSQRGSDGKTGITYEVTGPFRTSVTR